MIILFMMHFLGFWRAYEEKNVFSVMIRSVLKVLFVMFSHIAIQYISSLQHINYYDTPVYLMVLCCCTRSRIYLSLSGFFILIRTKTFYRENDYSMYVYASAELFLVALLLKTYSIFQFVRRLQYGRCNNPRSSFIRI